MLRPATSLLLALLVAACTRDPDAAEAADEPEVPTAESEPTEPDTPAPSTSGPGVATQSVAATPEPTTSATVSSCEDPSLRSLTPPEVPDSLPTAPQYGIWGYRFTDDFLSAGNSQPSDYEAWMREWITRARIPFFDRPGGSVSAWLERGWIAPTGADPMSAAENLAPSYPGVDMNAPSPSLLVRERRDDGWSAVALEPVFEEPQWTHDCLFGLGEDELTYRSWESTLSWGLYFRFSDPPQPLRAAPSDDSELVLMIPVGPGESSMNKIEVEGDWMRVGVSVPSSICYDEPEPLQGYEGWIRWRTPEQGVLLRQASGIC